jgi:hypothetical protein
LTCGIHDCKPSSSLSWFWETQPPLHLVASAPRDRFVPSPLPPMTHVPSHRSGILSLTRDLRGTDLCHSICVWIVYHRHTPPRRCLGSPCSASVESDGIVVFYRRSQPLVDGLHLSSVDLKLDEPRFR